MLHKLPQVHAADVAKRDARCLKVENLIFEKLNLSAKKIRKIYFKVLSKKLTICQKASPAAKLSDSWPSLIMKPCGSP